MLLRKLRNDIFVVDGNGNYGNIAPEVSGQGVFHGCGDSLRVGVAGDDRGQQEQDHSPGEVRPSGGGHQEARQGVPLRGASTCGEADAL